MEWFVKKEKQQQQKREKDKITAFQIMYKDSNTILWSTAWFWDHLSHENWSVMYIFCLILKQNTKRIWRIRCIHESNMATQMKWMKIKRIINFVRIAYTYSIWVSVLALRAAYVCVSETFLLCFNSVCVFFFLILFSSSISQL